MEEIITTTTYTACNACGDEWSSTVCLTAGGPFDAREFYISYVLTEHGNVVASYDYECATIADAFSVAKQLADSEKDVWLNDQMAVICSIVAAQRHNNAVSALTMFNYLVKKMGW